MNKKRQTTFTVDDLRAFESEVIEKYEGANIRGPIHLSHGNEESLISIFQYIDKSDWVFSTWRNHYHALLHGIDRDWLMSEILAGRSINISNGNHRFHTSAIVNGIIPIATGVAMGIKRKNDTKNSIETYDDTHVWCFIGDMAYSSGAFHESYKYAVLNNLPITFVVEDNGKSTNTPTQKSWNIKHSDDKPYTHYSSTIQNEFAFSNITKISEKLWYYKYERYYPHVGIGRWVYFAIPFILPIFMTSRELIKFIF